MSILYSDLKLCDIHMHIMEPHSLIPEHDFQMPTCDNAADIINIMRHCGLEKANILAITLYDLVNLVCNPLALYAKTLSPERIFAFGGLKLSCDAEESRDIVSQVGELIDAGFDGFKLIFKPNVRRKYKFAVDDPAFDGFYAWAQEKQYPILFHAGDPASFWKRDEAPEWAVSSGWYYGDDRMIPTPEELYKELFNVLKRYPLLNITFAHFLFLSSDFARLEGLFEEFKNMRLDVTPGIEMYMDFADNRQKANEFFTRYCDRLLFGTDNVAVNGPLIKENLKHSGDKVKFIRSFFETEEELIADGKNINGIGLSKEVCRRMYSENFLSFIGKSEPNKVDKKKAYDLCRNYKSMICEDFYHRKETMDLLDMLGNIFSPAGC